MKHTNFEINIMDLVLFLLSVGFLLGMLFLFGPCGPREDGSYMTCHWAGNTVAGLAAVLVITALVRLLVRNRQIKMGISISMIPICALASLIPGKVIPLCMMQDMRCRAVMAPAVIVCSGLLIVASVKDSIHQYRRACK